MASGEHVNHIQDCHYSDSAKYDRHQLESYGKVVGGCRDGFGADIDKIRWHSDSLSLNSHVNISLVRNCKREPLISLINHSP